MDSVTTKKTLTVSRGLTYTYYVSPASPGKPTLLLHHGFPDSAHLWSDFIAAHLVPSGYGVIAPDLLGYAGTSKPTDPSAFKYRRLVGDLVEILDAEKVAKVVSLGHDWGSAMAQRVYNLAPGRVEGLVVVNVAYTAPSNDRFSLDAAIEQTQKAFGRGLFWYWKLFTAADGAALLDARPDLLFDAVHASAESWARETLCVEDGLRGVLEGKKAAPAPQAYATAEMKAEFVARVGADGLDSPLCWYRATVSGEQAGEADEGNVVVNVPTLFVAYPGDKVCVPEAIAPAVERELLPKLRTVELEGTHWGLLDKPEEFGKAVLGWLGDNYGEGKKP